MRIAELMIRQGRRDGAMRRGAVTQTLAAALLLGVTATARAELPSATAADIAQALGAGHPTVIDVGARTCIPCRKMEPILESLAMTYRGKVSVLFVDLKEDQETARALRVQMIPTQIFFDAQGQEVTRHIGFMGEPAILAQLKTLGVQTPGAE